MCFLIIAGLLFYLIVPSAGAIGRLFSLEIYRFKKKIFDKYENIDIYI